MYNSAFYCAVKRTKQDSVRAAQTTQIFCLHLIQFAILLLCNVQMVFFWTGKVKKVELVLFLWKKNVWTWMDSRENWLCCMSHMWRYYGDHSYSDLLPSNPSGDADRKWWETQRGMTGVKSVRGRNWIGNFYNLCILPRKPYEYILWSRWPKYAFL